MNKTFFIKISLTVLLSLATIPIIAMAEVANTKSQSDFATLLTMHQYEQEYNPIISPNGMMFLALRQQGNARKSFNSQARNSDNSKQWSLFHMENGDIANDVLAADKVLSNTIRWLDDTHISFVANRAGGLGLWRMRADGLGAVNRLQRLPEMAVDALALSDDGALIVLQDERSKSKSARHMSKKNHRNHTILRILPDGSSETLATGNQPALSLNGKFIAFSMIEKKSGKKSKKPAHLFTIATDGSQLSQITFGEHHDIQPVWHPNGKTLVFVSDRGESSDNFAMPSANKQQKNWDLWQTDIEGVHLQRLTKDEAKDESAVVANDGSRILFHSDRKVSADEIERRHMTKGKASNNASHIWTLWLAKDAQ
ncbi:MAG: hypothetical protein R8L53_10375 [Mariprofundales bacterium]